MQELILLKLGGSLITDKNKAFTAKEKVIRRLGKEIKEALEKYKGKIIIGHGSGSFGHSVAAKYKTQEGIINKKSLEGLPLVADAAVQINRIVIVNLLKCKLPVVSFAPASFIYTNEKIILSSFIEPMEKALETGFVPVIYGDIIFDEKRGFCIYSGEKTLNLLADKLQKKYSIRIIYCGDTDGVYDARGKTIPVITPKSFVRIKKEITGSKSVDVTGGMIHKVEESLEVARRFGIKTYIINGGRAGEINRALLRKKIFGSLIKI